MDRGRHHSVSLAWFPICAFLHVTPDDKKATLYQDFLSKNLNWLRPAVQEILHSSRAAEKCLAGYCCFQDFENEGGAWNDGSSGLDRLVIVATPAIVALCNPYCKGKCLGSEAGGGDGGQNHYK